MTKNILLKLIILIICVSLSGNFAYFTLDKKFFSGDSFSYIIPASNLFNGHGFTDKNYIVETKRTPGYPLLLTLFMALSLDVEHIIIFQHLINVILAVALLIVTLKITRNLFIAFLASVIFSIDFPSIYHANKILSETFFTAILFVTFIMLYYLVATEKQNKNLCILCGLLGGLTALIRPVSFFFFIPSTLYLFITLRSKGTKLVILFNICFLLLPSLWIIRNYIKVGVATISSISDVNILYYRGGGILALREPGDFLLNMKKQREALRKKANEQLESIYGANLNKIPHAQKAKHYSRLGWEIILKYPFDYIKLTLRGIFMIMFGGNTDALALITGFNYKFVKTLVILYTTISAFLALLGSKYLFKKNKKFFYLIVLTISYFVILPAGGESDVRFKLPIMPMYSILIASGLYLSLNYLNINWFNFNNICSASHK